MEETEGSDALTVIAIIIILISTDIYSLFEEMRLNQYLYIIPVSKGARLRCDYP